MGGRAGRSVARLNGNRPAGRGVNSTEDSQARQRGPTATTDGEVRCLWDAGQAIKDDVARIKPSRVP